MTSGEDGRQIQAAKVGSQKSRVPLQRHQGNYHPSVPFPSTIFLDIWMHGRKCSWDGLGGWILPDWILSGPCGTPGGKLRTTYGSAWPTDNFSQPASVCQVHTVAHKNSGHVRETVGTAELVNIHDFFIPIVLRDSPCGPTPLDGKPHERKL